MAAVRPDIERMWAIITRLEPMYREWNELESREWRRAMVPSPAFPAMFDRHRDMIAGFDDDALKARIAANADLLEAYAVLAFSRAARNLGDAAPGEDEKINPYAVSLDPGRWEADGLFDGEGLTVDRGAAVGGRRDGEPVHGGDRAAGVAPARLVALRDGSPPPTGSKPRLRTTSGGRDAAPPIFTSG